MLDFWRDGLLRVWKKGGWRLTAGSQEWKTGRGKICAGWIRITHHPNKRRSHCHHKRPLISVLPHVLSRIRHLFDLCCEPDAVHETLHVMNEIQPGLCVCGRRVPGSFEPFETAVRAILGQQITVKAASTLAGRMAWGIGDDYLKQILKASTAPFPRQKIL